jgi:hypothetical protein
MLPLVFIGSPLNGEKSPTMGKIFSFAGLIDCEWFTDVDDLTLPPR